MSAKLYGLGIGPGDPELITLKALRIMKESHIIAVPGEQVDKSVAYQIARQAYKELDHKTVIAIHMPMIKDEKQLQESHELGAKTLESYLKDEKQVAFLTLGDPTIYSTYLYLHRLVIKHGYEAEIVSGIPSFCAVASRLNRGLVEKSEALHIIPASYPTEEALELSGTKVLMKAGRKIGEVKQRLLEKNIDAVMIENCGMKEEKIYYHTSEIPEDAGYYSLMIVNGHSGYSGLS